jgi:tripartite-type tricarboxylate transporter receptor subunit TctC
MMKEIKAALQVATVQAAWERNGSDVPDVVGAQFGALVTAEVTRWRKVVAEAGVTMQ